MRYAEEMKIEYGPGAPFLKVVPTIEGDRVVLSEITLSDKDAYNRLALDDLLNKYWGYDYKDDCKEWYENYFVDIAKEDFQNHDAINWAIRIKGDNAMIGEVVLYEFDYQGRAEVGIRLLPQFQGKGFAEDALRHCILYAINFIGFKEIVAKCYKENTKSFKLLEKILEKTQSDETFYRFKLNK